MATWEDANWESAIDSGVLKAVQRSGHCRRCLPDLLEGVGLPIKGIAPFAQHVVLAELGQSQTVREIRVQAKLVVNNKTIVRDAITELVGTNALTVEQSEALITEIDDLREAWTDRLTTHRVATGVRPTPRADSAVARLLAQLPEAPVATATTLAKILNVSFPAASAALEELRHAEILTTKSIERGAKAYMAREVLDLITMSERALASTRFDTRVSAPNRGAPARPHD